MVLVASLECKALFARNCYNEEKSMIEKVLYVVDMVKLIAVWFGRLFVLR